MESLHDFSIVLTREKDKFIHMCDLKKSKEHYLATNWGTKESSKSSNNVINKIREIKIQKITINKGKKLRAIKVLELVHSDLMGTFPWACSLVRLVGLCLPIEFVS
jgi:hypothetical protein